MYNYVKKNCCCFCVCIYVLFEMSQANCKRLVQIMKWFRRWFINFTTDIYKKEIYYIHNYLFTSTSKWSIWRTSRERWIQYMWTVVVYIYNLSMFLNCEVLKFILLLISVHKTIGKVDKCDDRRKIIVKLKQIDRLQQ